jgi:hypothetical protein
VIDVSDDAEIPDHGLIGVGRGRAGFLVGSADGTGR